MGYYVSQSRSQYNLHHSYHGTFGIGCGMCEQRCPYVLDNRFTTMVTLRRIIRSIICRRIRLPVCSDMVVTCQHISHDLVRWPPHEIGISEGVVERRRQRHVSISRTITRLKSRKGGSSDGDSGRYGDCDKWHGIAVSVPVPGQPLGVEFRERTRY